MGWISKLFKWASNVLRRFFKLFGKHRIIVVPVQKYCEDDILDVPGDKNCLDVGKYALYAVREAGFDPFSDTNADSMMELENRLTEATRVFVGLPVTLQVKNSVKYAVQNIVQLMVNMGAFSKW